MNEKLPNPPIMDVPTAAQAAIALDRARRIYARTLSHWMSDALVLRRRGWDRPAWPLNQSVRNAA